PPAQCSGSPHRWPSFSPASGQRKRPSPAPILHSPSAAPQVHSAPTLPLRSKPDHPPERPTTSAFGNFSCRNPTTDQSTDQSNPPSRTPRRASSSRPEPGRSKNLSSPSKDNKVCN